MSFWQRLFGVLTKSDEDSGDDEDDAISVHTTTTTRRRVVTQKLVSGSASSSSGPDTTTSSSSSYDTSSYETTSSYEGGGGDGNGRIDNLAIVLRMINDDSYFTNSPYKKYLPLMLDYYGEFIKHSPIPRGGGGGKEFTCAELKGLEYLMDPSFIDKHPAMMEFPCIHFRELKALKSTLVAQDTFLVSSLMDYLFSYVVELALLGTGKCKSLPLNMNNTRRRYRKRKMESYKSCQVEHSDRNDTITRCPCCWLVYTKRNSDFFMYCQRLTDQNRYITYDVNDEFMNIVPLSFYLVSFLCGPFDNAEATKDGEGVDEKSVIDFRHEETQVAEGYDQWVIVPLYFIDLWNTRTNKELK